MYVGEGEEVSVLIFKVRLACVLLHKLAHPVEVLGVPLISVPAHFIRVCLVCSVSHRGHC